MGLLVHGVAPRPQKYYNPSHPNGLEVAMRALTAVACLAFVIPIA
jgi:hypothetical protein